MKRLLVMRHAKSDWSGATSDHDRPLNPRGRAAAKNLGDWLREVDWLPDTVLSSSAARTEETCARLHLPDGTQTVFTRDLYLAEPARILSNLRGADGETVLIIGHNPGIGIFAEEMLDTDPAHPAFAQYPTGATLAATLDVANWSEAHWALARQAHFVIPREL